MSACCILHADLVHTGIEVAVVPFGNSICLSLLVAAELDWGMVVDDLCLP